MAEFDRKSLRAIFEGADLELPPKDVLGKICDLHISSSDSKDETIKELTKQLDDVKRERDTLKAENEVGYKEKYEKEHKAFTDYKADVERKASHDTKEAAVKAYLESKNITGANLDIAMMAVSGSVDGMELDGEKLKDTKPLDDLIGGKLSRLVVKTETKGAQTATPPANNGGDTFASLPLADKMAYANEHPNDQAVKDWLGKK